MAKPNRESIETFMSITGSSKPVAIRKLTEHHGGLNEAVNSYFTEGDANIRHETNVPPQRDLMDIDETDGAFHQSHRANTASGMGDVTNALAEIVPETRVTGGTDDDVAGGISRDTCLGSSAPGISNSPDYAIEEEMVQAAIEASKRKAETGLPDDVSADQEKVSHETHEIESEAGQSEKQASKLVEVKEAATQASSNGRSGVGSSSIEDETEEPNEQPLVRRRRRRVSSSSGPRQQQTVNDPDWGGISSEEHDMLEAAMFDGVYEGAGYARNYYTRNGLGRTNRPYTRSARARAPRPPSPSLTAQRLIREQQDDEYHASLQADREKQLLEQAAREAAMEEQQRKLEQEQEMERKLAAKEASLPQEPASDDENAVTLLVRMPDGSRRSRRFMKTDKLQFLFDFIDVGRLVKPSTYRLVRPYPRRAFSDGENGLVLSELGLTTRQEALFLELI